MTVISDCNPMTYILPRKLLGGKYCEWIVILQELDLEFIAAKSKKSLVFTDLICSFPSDSAPSPFEDFIPENSLFFISTLDPWYSDIIVYLQTSSFRSDLMKDACRRIRRSEEHTSELQSPYAKGYNDESVEWPGLQLVLTSQHEHNTF